MAQPTAFNRLVNFVAYQLAHTDEPYNPADHDQEWANIEITVDGILANLLLIQRDDGSLANQSVHQDSLTSAVLAIIESAGSATGLAALIKGTWATTTVYAVGEIVQESTTSYVCAEAHTSGTFATDYAAGKWIIFGDTRAANAAALPFTPAGDIAATDVQAAIVELDDEKAKVNGDAAELFSVKDATDDAHAASMGQIQRNDIVYVAATGTGDALLATLVSGLTVLTDGFKISTKAPGANTVTAPTMELTLGSTSTTALAIVKGNGTALVAGDISSNQIELMYDSVLTKWVLLNPLFPVGIASSDDSMGSPKNLALAFSVGSSALTCALKAAGGANPSSTDKVTVPMRSATVALGTFVTREITAALSLVVSSGSTLGHASTIAGKLHWYVIDNAGTLELAVSAMYYGQSGIVTTLAEGGAGTADSAASMYSTSARAAVAFQWIGETIDTQTTAGTWAAVPTSVSLIKNNDVPAIENGFRLSLTTAVPVTTSDVTAATNIFLVPFRGNRITLWDASFGWKTYASPEVSTGTLVATSGKPYDIFSYIDAGVVKLETLVWTDDTNRATALALHDGVYVKSGDPTRRYIGSFYASTTDETEDSEAKRYLWNYYNRVPRKMKVVDGTSTWSYATATFRQARATTTNQLDYIVGVNEEMVSAEVVASWLTSSIAGLIHAVGIGIDSTSVNGADLVSGTMNASANDRNTALAKYKGMPGVGRHFLPWLEYGPGSSATTWYGTSTTLILSGISGELNG